MTLARCYEVLGDLDAAVQTLSRGLQLFSRFYEGYLHRGILFNKQHRWDRAAADLKKAKSHPLTYLGLAEALLHLGEEPTALAFVKKVEATDSAEVLLKRAHLFVELQQFEKALTDLTAVLQLEPHNAEAYYFKAMVLFPFLLWNNYSSFQAAVSVQLLSPDRINNQSHAVGVD